MVTGSASWRASEAALKTMAADGFDVYQGDVGDEAGVARTIAALDRAPAASMSWCIAPASSTASPRTS